MRKILPILFLLALSPATAFARGGGGCLEQGTPIETPSGPVAVERLRPGQAVWSVQDGRLKAATVQAVFEAEANTYVELHLGPRTLRLTAEHPVQVAAGVYRAAGALRAGDRVVAWEDGRLISRPLRAVRTALAERPAYNLLVAPGGTYLAGGVVVHNKGCFLADTPILRPDGSSTLISSLRPGEKVLAFTPDGCVTAATIQEVLSLEVDAYVEVLTDRAVLRVTGDHPFYVGEATFRTLESLRPGDAVYAFDGNGLARQTLVSLRTVASRTRVYNLRTDAPHTFFAAGIAVHNKGGGCFPAGTRILTPLGPVPIEKMEIGGRVLTRGADGRIVETAVEAVVRTTDRILVLETTAGVLHTTTEHPLALDGGGFAPAGELRAGEGILFFRDGRFVRATILAVRLLPEAVPVFNLRVGPPHTFVAGGFLVHNKGGGGGGFHGGGSRGGSGGSMDKWTFIVIAGVIVVIVIVAAFFKANKSDENLDFSYSDAQVSRKAGKTLKLLEFIAQTDPAWKPQALQAHASAVFSKLQQCWEAREYAPMQPLMDEGLYRQHCAQIAGMVRNHEINKIANPTVDRVDLVNVRYTNKPDGREFTALLTATARDYYVDDRTGKTLRGDDSPQQFQEFWTFELRGGKWFLREIEQTRESDALKEENFFEPFTDRNIRQVYGDEAGKEGPAGPWLEGAVASKADRTERLLNFLVQTDKLWNRADMLERARDVFLRVMLAREKGDPAAVPADDLFPEVAASLRAELETWKGQGYSEEYRNLCVRKAELALVRNYPDNARDEYTVRISAHAQRVFRRQGQAVRQDEYVTPWVEFWTFGRLDNRWKLKEALPTQTGEGLQRQENVDQESSPAQLQWFYRQNRAT